MLPDLQTLARALGGEVNDGQVIAPGPGHSAKDRSLSVKLDNNAPDGFLVHSFTATILSFVVIMYARKSDFPPLNQTAVAIAVYRTMPLNAHSWRQ